jgi:hypothetical protein
MGTARRATTTRRGMARRAAEVLRCEGQATAKRRGQAAACVQEMHHVPLQLSTTRNQEAVTNAKVSASSSGRCSWRRAAGAEPHLKRQEVRWPHFLVGASTFGHPCTSPEHAEGARAAQRKRWSSTAARLGWSLRRKPSQGARATGRRAHSWRTRASRLAPSRSCCGSGGSALAVLVPVGCGRRSAASGGRRRARQQRSWKAAGRLGVAPRSRHVSGGATVAGARSRRRWTPACRHTRLRAQHGRQARPGERVRSAAAVASVQPSRLRQRSLAPSWHAAAAALAAPTRASSVRDPAVQRRSRCGGHTARALSPRRCTRTPSTFDRLELQGATTTRCIRLSLEQPRMENTTESSYLGLTLLHRKSAGQESGWQYAA